MPTVILPGGDDDIRYRHRGVQPPTVDDDDGDWLDDDSAEDFDAEQLTAEDLAEMETDTELAELFADKPKPAPKPKPVEAKPPVEIKPKPQPAAPPQPELLDDDKLRDPHFMLNPANAAKVAEMSRNLATLPLSQVGGKFTLPT